MKLFLVFTDSVVAREAERIGQEAALTRSAESIFEAPVDAILKIVGGKIFCFFDGRCDGSVQVAISDLVGTHVRETRVCEDVNARNKTFPDGD